MNKNKKIVFQEILKVKKKIFFFFFFSNLK